MLMIDLVFVVVSFLLSLVVAWVLLLPLIQRAGAVQSSAGVIPGSEVGLSAGTGKEGVTLNRQEQLLRELALLEGEFLERKIDQEDYQRQRASLMNQVVESYSSSDGATTC